jgi:hypothetical protein
MPDVTEFAIWWLSQEDQETLGDIPSLDDPDEEEERAAYRGPNLPEYIRREYSSRYGRPGRGRLWVAEELGLPIDFAIDEAWFDSRLGRMLAGYQDEFGHWHGGYGGVVIRAVDAPLVANLPGLVTDGWLSFWGPAKLAKGVSDAA